MYKGDVSCWGTLGTAFVFLCSKEAITWCLQREPQKRWTFSRGIDFRGILLPLQRLDVELRRVQSGSNPDHRSHAKCLLQITKNNLVVHWTILISQVPLHRASPAKNAALFILLGKSPPVSHSFLCKPYSVVPMWGLRQSLIQRLIFLALKGCILGQAVGVWLKSRAVFWRAGGESQW